MVDGISFLAVVNKVQTLALGGGRVSFDVPESEIAEMMKLAAIRSVVQVGIVGTPGDAPTARGAEHERDPIEELEDELSESDDGR